jgi:diguanylate cyclase (GGDEF)-like protein
VNSAGPELDWLAREGGEREAYQVRVVRISYDNYTRIIRSVLDDSPAAKLGGYSELATLYFTQLRGMVVENVDRKQRELIEYLDRVDSRTLILRWVMLVVAVIGFVMCLMGSVVLVAYQRRAERESSENRYKALHDTLTGLANRNLLAEQTERAIQAAGGEEGGAIGLLLIDLDRFKNINDTLGHHSGDELLRRVAARLVRSSRDTDLVARLGGDEFAILLRDVHSVDDMCAIARRIRELVQEPMELDGLIVDFGASVGAAAFPFDARTGDELLQHADVAMYVAKRSKLGVSYYTPSEDENDPERLSMVSELRQGLARGELVLHYQPKVDATTLRPVGLEALVRWQHPERGLLAPGVFLPLIEPTELIEQLTSRVLEMAIRQMGVWAQKGRRIPVAVNITPRSLLNSAFPEEVAGLLSDHAVSPELLTLELTESALITAPALASRTLWRLRRQGIRSSIDDFGTGYSSMASLRDMPVQELKIDRSFVTTMRSDERNHAIVDATIYLAKNLALDVVAEGVEDAATLRALRELGCGTIQGYHVSKPLPAAACDEWLDRHAEPIRADVSAGRFRE